MSDVYTIAKQFRISLRGLLLLVGLLAIVIPSLKYASDGWLVWVASFAIVAFLVALIVALVDRGPRQAFAIGFATTMLAFAVAPSSPWRDGLPTTRLLRYIYPVVQRGEWIAAFPSLLPGATGDLVEVLQRALNARTHPSPNIRVDGDFGPNTEAAVKRFQLQAGLVSAPGVVDDATWKALGPMINPRTGRILAQYVPLSTGAGSKPNTFPITGISRVLRDPPPQVFMQIGECWWAILLGYAGGHFARHVYWRRLGEPPRQAADFS
ncbi:MAG TPA: peptidoglycan-binding protein [Lacipirellulaceae bacterium]|nr:peptidoglycan-binding protein [Lacipirellulaceae bacterium]